MTNKNNIPTEIIPNWVIKGIRKGMQDGREKNTKSTEEIMRKYLYNQKRK